MLNVHNMFYNQVEATVSCTPIETESQEGSCLQGGGHFDIFSNKATNICKTIYHGQYRWVSDRLELSTWPWSQKHLFVSAIYQYTRQKNPKAHAGDIPVIAKRAQKEGGSSVEMHRYWSIIKWRERNHIYKTDTGIYLLHFLKQHLSGLLVRLRKKDLAVWYFCQWNHPLM